MIVEYLINSALASGRLVITQPAPGRFILKVKIGGAYLRLASCVVPTDEQVEEVIEAPAAAPVKKEEPEQPATNVVSFPRAVT